MTKKRTLSIPLNSAISPIRFLTSWVERKLTQSYNNRKVVKTKDKVVNRDRIRLMKFIRCFRSIYGRSIVHCTT